MGEGWNLLVLVLALGSGLAAATAAAVLAQARRTALFRGLLASIALFNLLILGGLVFAYLQIHFPDVLPSAGLALLAGMTIVKIAWVLAFAMTVRALLHENVGGRFRRRSVAAGAVVLMAQAVLLAGGLLLRRPALEGAGIALVEVAVLLGAILAAAWLIRGAGRASGPRRTSLLYFGGFHLAIFVSMAIGVAWGWLGPRELSIGSRGVVMIAYNLFPLVWLWRFDPGGAKAPDEGLQRHGITPREREIIALICEGRTRSRPPGSGSA